MAADTATTLRISKIAGRYLVFDPEGVAALRRDLNTNGTLVGTLPQQPTQNIFLGLPVEIRPEEAQALVQKGRARVVDDVAAHRVALNSGDRTAYIEGLRKKKVNAERLIADRRAEKAAESLGKHGRASGSGKKSRRNAKDAAAPATQDTDDLLFDNDATPQPPAKDSRSEASNSLPPTTDSQLAVTPTVSEGLLSEAVEQEFDLSDAPEAPLARFLQGGGYYMTPGLRFGARYSVYPGDPLRFHAHFMANQYGWDEPIPILDLVEGGRLATAVKKALVVGGENPSTKEVRTFSIEWAGM